MKKRLWIPGLILMLQMTQVYAAAPTTEIQKLGYALGFSLGNMLKQDRFGAGELDIKIVQSAISDVLNKVEPKLSSDKLQATIQAYQASKQSDSKSAPPPRKDLSYTLGFSLGSMLQQERFTLTEIDLGFLTAAIDDVLNGAEPQLPMDKMQAAMQTYQIRKQAEMKTRASVALQKSRDWLMGNGKKKGIKTTPNGLQYKILKSGKGKKPLATDTVEVHYEGRLISGKVFDSSIQRGEPVTFPVNGVIKGWQEALVMMASGSKWEVYIPPELAYGERGTGAIGPNEALVFQIELIGVK